jgi:glycosyltransferase involved in cell wall biosynthesis
MHYVKHVAVEAVARGYDVELITSTLSVEHPAYKLLEEPLGDALSTTFLPEYEPPARWLRGGDLPRKQLRYYLLFRRFFRSRAFDRNPLFVPFIDHCDKYIGLFGDPFGGREWSALSLGVKFHDRELGVIRPRRADDPAERVLFRRMLSNRRLKALLTIDPLLPTWVERHIPRLAGKMNYAPDPIELDDRPSREDARRQLGVGDDEIVVLVYGIIQERNGVGSLIATMLRDDLPRHFSLLLAGPQDEEIRARLGGPEATRLREQGRLREVDRFLSGPDEGAMFLAADIGWLGYVDFYRTSAVLLQFGRARRPVVAAREGTVGWLNRRYGLGIEVDPRDHAANAAALNQLGGDRELAARCADNGYALAQGHSTAEFARRVCDAAGL